MWEVCIAYLNATNLLTSELGRTCTIIDFIDISATMSILIFISKGGTDWELM